VVVQLVKDRMHKLSFLTKGYASVDLKVQSQECDMHGGYGGPGPSCAGAPADPDAEIPLERGSHNHRLQAHGAGHFAVPDPVPVQSVRRITSTR
jgi:hypothetical protein